MIAAAGLMPNRFANSLFTTIELSRRRVRRAFVSPETLLSILLSRIPVRETPSRASSSQFFFHSLERYGKFVRDAWNVPRIVAIRIFLIRVSSVSVARTTTSERLQNSRSRNKISLQGLHPHSWSGSRRSPSFSTVFFAASRLKIPRSPLLDL